RNLWPEEFRCGQRADRNYTFHLFEWGGVQENHVQQHIQCGDKQSSECKRFGEGLTRLFDLFRNIGRRVPAAITYINPKQADCKLLRERSIYGSHRLLT